ncbi:MAG: hypothetical protein AB8B55_08835 [Mariniblastus sp.]
MIAAKVHFGGDFIQSQFLFAMTIEQVNAPPKVITFKVQYRPGRSADALA